MRIGNMSTVEAVISLLIVFTFAEIMFFEKMSLKQSVTFDTMLTHVPVDGYYTSALAAGEGYNVHCVTCLADTVKHELFLFFGEKYDGYEVGFIGIQKEE